MLFPSYIHLLDEIGIDGFKTDGGECIYGSDLQFADGRDGATMRNEYSNAYSNAYVHAFHSFANQFVKGGAITFSRSGYAGAQLTPMHWAGDEKSTFQAFRSSLIAGLSSGLSGIPFWGWDFAGFSGEIPTAELYIRSAQMAAFCPVMQYHAESKGQFNMDWTPWNIAERTQTFEVLTIYKKFADLRMNLLPYIYKQAQISSSSGEPLMRALLLDYPEDAAASKIETQYLFGQALLVAPILEEGHRELEVYFPPGSWVSFFNEHEGPIDGGQSLTIEAELAHIPVYIRENYVVPLNVDDSLQLATHVGNQVEGYHELVFMIYATSQVNYHFHDDDEGIFVAISIEINSEQGVLKVEVDGAISPVLWLKQADHINSLTLKNIENNVENKLGSKIENNTEESKHGNNIELKEVYEEEQLEEHCFMRRGQDLLVRLQQGSQVMSW